MADGKKPAKRDDRRGRLAAALRANLRRRKGQARARGECRETVKEKTPKR